MKRLLDQWFLRLFFGVAACSWMPHWACHYYRLETQSSFIVGSWDFSFTDSVVSLLIYTVLIVLSLLAIQIEKLRLMAATLTGIGHLSIGSLHAFRLAHPFAFEVFGHSWSQRASLREAVIVLPFAVLSLLVAVSLNFERSRA